MMTLMRDGGWPMWFMLTFGLITLGSAARFAIRPASVRIAFIEWMGRATLLSIATGVAADLAAVGHNVGRDWEEIAKQGPVARVAFIGVAESMSPAILGFTILSLAALLIAVGKNRIAEE